MSAEGGLGASLREAEAAGVARVALMFAASEQLLLGASYEVESNTHRWSGFGLGYML